MRIIRHSINAALLIIRFVLVAIDYVVGAPIRLVERQLTVVSFGDGPNSMEDWLAVLCVWAVLYFLFTVYF